MEAIGYHGSDTLPFSPGQYTISFSPVALAWEIYFDRSNIPSTTLSRVRG